MSDASPPPAPEPPPVPASPGPPPEQRNGCLTALMAIAGVIMLLPGICGLIFGVGNLGSSFVDPVVTLLALLGLAIGVGGIFLIRAAIRGRR
jgi:hypothetical protein